MTKEQIESVECSPEQIAILLYRAGFREKHDETGIDAPQDFWDSSNNQYVGVPKDNRGLIKVHLLLDISRTPVESLFDLLQIASTHFNLDPEQQ